MNRRYFLKSALSIGDIGLKGVIGLTGRHQNDKIDILNIDVPEYFVDKTESARIKYKPIINYLEDEIANSANLRFSEDHQELFDNLYYRDSHLAEAVTVEAITAEQGNDEPTKAKIVLQKRIRKEYNSSSVIITRKNHFSEFLSDLNNEKIAFGLPLSTHSSIYPLKMLNDAGLDIGDAPETDDKADFEAVWNSSPEKAYERLIDETVAAAGVARHIVTNENDELKEDIRILDKDKKGNSSAIYPDIPNDPLVVSPNLSDDKQKIVRNTLEDAPDSIYFGPDGKEGTDQDHWYDGAKSADITTYNKTRNQMSDMDISVERNEHPQWWTDLEAQKLDCPDWAKEDGECPDWWKNSEGDCPKPIEEIQEGECPSAGSNYAREHSPNS